MAPPRPTPALPEEEIVTPLQKMLTGTLFGSIIFVPLTSFALYLLPFYKMSELYRGTYWVIGAVLGIGLGAALAVFWMTRLPRMISRRAERSSGRGRKGRAPLVAEVADEDEDAEK